MFQDKLRPYERSNWTDLFGVSMPNKDLITLNFDKSKNWKWHNQWKLEIDLQNTDMHGWSYSRNFDQQFYQQRSLLSFVRRRKWTRLAVLDSNENN